MPKTTKKSSQSGLQNKRLSNLARRSDRVSTKTGKKSRRSAPKAALVPEAPVTLKGLLALSTEMGVFVAITTSFDSPMLADFRLAAKDPFPRVISAPVKRCRLSIGEWKDEKTELTERLYLAFIPTPAGAMVEGNILYGAKAGKQQCFVSVPSQRYAQLEPEKQRKILYVLQPRLAEIVEDCLPDEHVMRQLLGEVTVIRREQEAWASVQATIKSHLERQDGQAALRELEPLVYTSTPKAPAEKLLSEILLKTGAAEQRDLPTDSVRGALHAESLMLRYLLGRLSKKTGANSEIEVS